MMRVIDGKPYVRPCTSIPADGNEANDWIASFSDLYGSLTKPIPLAGGSSLLPLRPGGEPRIAAALRAEAPWSASALNRIAEQAAMSAWAGQPWLALRPLLLVGPPGTGKTHLARRLGELSGCGDAVLSFAGISSNAEIAGSPRGFRNPQPCFAALAIHRTGTANPVIVIDEADKSRSGDTGDPVATLLPLLEQTTAARFFDGCLATEIDLGHVNWVLTANSTANVPAALLSRVDVVEVDGPRPEHAEVLLSSLWAGVARQTGLPPSALPHVEAAAEAALLRLFRNTRSVRRLRRAIETLFAVSVRHSPRPLN